ncbi:sensor histidine kinase [Dyadobacter sp. CY312]|uniref:sensor histidine kinase n=1 Tax=Dyadobacter sp. CY312 TaxID=2907303 RepID=UPI001F415A01|nr:sensor histidine kinase [Dyadobacter sp. CY312]MCE7039727.1 sensor histidine kinase [Dyadobacter sp. CY312]
MENPGELEFSQLLFGGLAFVFVLALSLIIFFLLYQRKLHKQAQIIQDQELQYQKDLTGLVVNSQENERERISRDLHDEIGGALSAAKLYINQIQYETSAEEMMQLASNANGILENTVQEIRQIAQNLSPLSIEEFGFQQAVRMLLTRIEAGGVNAECEINFDAKLNRQTELGLYRIVQEATGNALKHANPELIEVTLNQNQGFLILTISDDGCGFDYQEADNAPKQSMGLSGIKARISSLNGKLNISSSPGSGTRIELMVPIV